jgi:hypothetical protein
MPLELVAWIPTVEDCSPAVNTKSPTIDRESRQNPHTTPFHGRWACSIGTARALHGWNAAQRDREANDRGQVFTAHLISLADQPNKLR